MIMTFNKVLYYYKGNCILKDLNVELPDIKYNVLKTVLI